MEVSSSVWRSQAHTCHVFPAFLNSPRQTVSSGQCLPWISSL